MTAEHKVNRYGFHYTYYHCAKRRLGPRCKEPSVRDNFLEAQIVAFLDSLSVPAPILAWAEGWLSKQAVHEHETEQAQRRSLHRAMEDVKSQQNELTNLRLRRLLTDDEYLTRRRELEGEQSQLEERFRKDTTGGNRFEPFRAVISFRNHAADWFHRGDENTRRLILLTVGSNLTLQDKILSIQAAKPFTYTFSLAYYPGLLAGVDDVRTLKKTRPSKKALHQFVDEVLTALNADPRRDHILENIAKLQQIVDPKQDRKVA